MSFVWKWKNQIFELDHPAIALVRQIVKKLKIDEVNQRVKWSTGQSLGDVFLALINEIPIKDIKEENLRRNAYYQKQLSENFSMPYGILRAKEDGILLANEFLRRAGYQKGEVLGHYDEASRQKRLKNKARFDEALEWLKGLAHAGDPHAQYFYSTFFHSYQIEIDHERWAYWIIKAALQGHYGAIFGLGHLIFDGLLSWRHRRLGKRCWELLIDQNIEIVRYELRTNRDIRLVIVRMLMDVWLRIRPKNRLEKQAEAADVDSTVLYKLYGKYRSSWSKFYDPKKALYYLKRWIGPDNGASDQLADHYYYGDIVERDFDRAVHLYRKAAETSYGYRACERLAILYYEGVAVPRDLNQSLKYFLLAIEKNSHTAKDNIEYLINERVFPESVRALINPRRRYPENYFDR